jgi:hypothetical protein
MEPFFCPLFGGSSIFAPNQALYLLRVFGSWVGNLHRKDAESLAEVLCSAGVASRYYHADMDPHLRLEAHKEWSKGEAQVGKEVAEGT